MSATFLPITRDRISHLAYTARRALLSSDLSKLQGTWRVAALRMDGRAIPPAEFARAEIVVTGDRFTSTGMGAVYDGTLQLRPRTKPKGLDMLFGSGHAAGVRNVGIYALEGNTWRLCFATRGTKRPARFASRPGSGIALETLTRAVEPNARTGAERPRPARTRRGKAGSSPLDGEWSMTAGVFNGAAMSPDMLKWCRRVTAGGVTTVMAGPQTMLAAAFAVDMSVVPHHIDYENLAGSHAGRKQAGIFRLTDDGLEICMAAPGKARPSDFSSSRGDGRSYTAWRRP